LAEMTDDAPVVAPTSTPPTVAPRSTIPTVAPTLSVQPVATFPAVNFQRERYATPGTRAEVERSRMYDAEQESCNANARAQLDAMDVHVPIAAATASTTVPTESTTHLGDLEQFQLGDVVRLSAEPGAGAQHPIVTGVRNLNEPLRGESSSDEEVVTTRVLPVLPSVHDAVAPEDRNHRRLVEDNAEALELLRDFRNETTERAPDAARFETGAAAVPDDVTMGDDAVASETDGGTIGRIRSVDDVSGRSGLTASDVSLSRALNRRSPECLEHVRALRARIREGITDAVKWAEAMNLWKLHVSEANYDNYSDDRIPFIASVRGLTDERGLETIEEQRNWLWNHDFQSFLIPVRSAPAYDAMAVTFTEIYDRAKHMGDGCRDVACRGRVLQRPSGNMHPRR
jgi:hypothetical protein